MKPSRGNALSLLSRLARLSALLLAPTTGAHAADLTTVRVNTFPVAQALPFYVGMEKGFFARQGISVALEFTANSQEQRRGLANGTSHILFSAVDNALAMVEVAHEDVVIVSGGDSGTNELIVQKGIESYADIRGKALVADAPDTAFALQAKKILARNGLKAGVDYRINPVGAGPFRMQAMLAGGDNAVAIMNLPYSVLAVEAGMKSFGRTTDMLGPYQASGMFAMRAWANANSETLERYLAGYISALRWVLDRANRDEAIALLVARRNLSPSVAARSYDLLLEPGFGFNVDARLDSAGFDNVMALRQEVEGGPTPAASKYLDPSHYQRALARLAQ